jgi:hypothetical protein
VKMSSLYRATKMPSSTTCPDGHRVSMLMAHCLTKMPSFFICDTCAFIGEIGVGVVRDTKGKRG